MRIYFDYKAEQHDISNVGDGNCLRTSRGIS